MVRKLFLLDTHAWIEYLIGSDKGRKVKILIDTESCITIECSLAELHLWALKNNRNFDDIYVVVRKNSTIIPIFGEDWIESPKIKHELSKKRKDFGLIDAILRFKQLKLSAKIVTGDPHFEGLSDSIII